MIMASAARPLARISIAFFSMWLALGATSALAQGQGLASVGLVDPANGFPQYYQDRSGKALAQCLTDPTTTTPVADPCALTGTLPLGDGPVVFPTNFPQEFFYMRAVGVMRASDGTPIGSNGAGRATLVLALEGAFATGGVQDGQQMVFARMRLRVLGGALTPGATYTLTHPYGVTAYVADGNGEINDTNDQGILPLDFAAVLTNTNVGPFLQAANPPAPPGYIGDPNITHSVAGSPYGTNVFRIDGPNIGGPGVNTRQTDQFLLIGKLWTGTLATNLTIDRTSYARSSTSSAQVNVFAHAAGTDTVVVTGTGIPATTLLRDDATGRFFQRVIPTTPASLPGTVRLTSTSGTGGTPTMRDSLLVDEVTITRANYDPATRQLSILASSSDKAPAPTLQAYTTDLTAAIGTLDSAGSLLVNLAVPTAQIRIVSSAGGSSTVPVTVAATAPASGTVSFNPAGTLAFGNLNNTTATRTVTLTIGGGTAVTFGTATVTDGAGAVTFSKGADTCSGTTRAVGATCTIDVIGVFPPRNTPSTGTLSVPHNGSASPGTLNLTGS